MEGCANGGLGQTHLRAVAAVGRLCYLRPVPTPHRRFSDFPLDKSLQRERWLFSTTKQEGRMGMSTHTITVYEHEFKLFQAIRHIDLDVPKKETLIEDLIRQIERWMQAHSLSAHAILDLPPQEKHDLLTAQFQVAEAVYREHPELIVPDGDEPLTY
jgi:hypothetical protein